MANYEVKQEEDKQRIEARENELNPGCYSHIVNVFLEAGSLFGAGIGIMYDKPGLFIGCVAGYFVAKLMSKHDTVTAHIRTRRNVLEIKDKVEGLEKSVKEAYKDKDKTD